MMKFASMKTRLITVLPRKAFDTMLNAILVHELQKTWNELLWTVLYGTKCCSCSSFSRHVGQLSISKTISKVRQQDLVNAMRDQIFQSAIYPAVTAVRSYAAWLNNSKVKQLLFNSAE